MNKTELKSYFYKRFSGAGTRLSLYEAGMPVPLMGYMSQSVCPFIGCRLSMSIKTAARPIEGNKITITSTNTDMRRTYRTDAPDGRDRVSEFLKKAEKYPLKGADILFDSSIPTCFDPAIPYIAAVAGAITENSGVSPSAAELTRLCAGYGESAQLESIFKGRGGWAGALFSEHFFLLPLPLTGLKILLVRPGSVPEFLDSRTTSAVCGRFKKIFPHISSFSDITERMLDISSIAIGSYFAKAFARHMVNENRLCIRAERALKKCRIREFGELMNESCLSQKLLCSGTDPCMFICDNIYRLKGVLGARLCEYGVIALAEEEMCDSIVGLLRADFEAEFGYSPVICIADSI